MFEELLDLVNPDDQTAQTVKVSSKFAYQVCPQCSLLFFMSDFDLAVRKQVGRSWYCPSGHEIKPEEKSVEASLRWQLDETQRGWEEQRDVLQGENIRLSRELARYKNAKREAEQRAENEAVEAEIEALKASGDPLAQAAPPVAEAALLPASEPDKTAFEEVARPKPEPPPNFVHVESKKWPENAEPKVCKNCDKEYGPKPGQQEHFYKKSRYCSFKCQQVYNAKRADEKKREKAAAARAEGDKKEAAIETASEQPRSWRDTAEPKVCPNCGDEFGPGPRHSQTMWEKIIRYCGPTCQIAASNRRAKEKLVGGQERKQAASELLAIPAAPPPVEAQEPTTGEHDDPRPEPASIIHLEPVEIVEPAPVEVALASPVPETKDVRVNRPARPIKMPSTASIARAPVPPPSLQAKLPDPKAASGYAPIAPGRVIERGDFGACPNEGCGRPLNAFKICQPCKQREKWLEGQRLSRINQARGSS